MGERLLRTSGTSRGGGKDSFAVKVSAENTTVGDVAKVHGRGGCLNFAEMFASKYFAHGHGF